MAQTNPGAPAAPGSTAQNAPAAPAAPAAVAEISGVVVSRHTPLPGVLVSAAHSISGRKYLTSTQVDGSYALVLPAFGRYVVRAELAGFATVTREILLDTAAPKARANLEMVLASRVPLAEAGRGLADTVAGNLGREIQNLVISGVDASAADPATGAANLPASSNPAMNPETATESVSLAGAMGRVNEAMAGGDPEAMQERIQEMRERAAREGLRPGYYTCQINIIDDAAGSFVFPRLALLVKPAPAPASARVSGQ